MSRTDAVWRQEMRRRFADREDIGKEELYEQFVAPKGLPRADVLALLAMIELEFDLPAGLLRPSDGVDKLAEPVSSRNAWQWMVFQVRSGDRLLAMEDQLAKRRTKFGTTDASRELETIGDLAAAWCGLRAEASNGQ